MLSQQIWDNGAACIGIASVFYAAAAGLVRPLNPSIPVLEIVAVRSALSLVFSRIAFLAQKPSASFFGQRKNMGFLAMRGLVGASAMDFFYAAIKRLTLGDAVSLLFCNPAITAALAVLLLHERMGWKGVAGCACSLLGMLFVVRPPMLFGNDAIADEQEEGVDANAFHVQRLTGSIFGVLSAFLAAGAYLSIRLIGKKESSLTIAVWFHSTAFIHSVVLLLLGWPQQPVWPSTRDCACFVGIAVSSFIANILLSRGFQLENAALASAVNYLQVICSHILGIAVFHEKLEPISLAGAGLILFGVVTVAVDSKKHEQHHGGLVVSSDSDARDGVELTMTAQKPPTDQEQDEEDAPLLQPRR